MRSLVLLLLVGLALAAPRADRDADIELQEEHSLKLEPESVKEEPKPDDEEHKAIDPEHRKDKSSSEEFDSEEFLSFLMGLVKAILEAMLETFKDPDGVFAPKAPAAPAAKE